MSMLDQLMDEFWGLVHEPITSPKRMKLVLAAVARAIAEDCPEVGSEIIAEWLLDQMVGDTSGFDQPTNQTNQPKQS